MHLHCIIVKGMRGPKSPKRYRHSLSSREATILTNLSFDGRSVFTTTDLPAALGDPGRRDLLKSLSRKGWIVKIRKGTYAVVPMEAGDRGAEGFSLDRFIVASCLADPYYIGYWSAMNHHGLTDQIPSEVYVATPKPRNSRIVMDYPIRFVTLSPRKFFGVEEVSVGDRTICVSSIEKTLADCLDHPEHCGGIDTIASALFFYQSELGMGKVLSSARRMGNSAILKRLGLLGEVLDIRGLEGGIDRSELGSGYSMLDPSAPHRGRIVEKWKLVVNAPVGKERLMP